MDIIIKNNAQIQAITESGKYLTELLYILRDLCVPGTNLLTLEQRASDYIQDHTLIGCFKGYQGYPSNTCLSVNQGLVHCIPCDYVLRPGDLIKVDTGINYQGGISDAAFAVVVGGTQSNPDASRLVRTTKKALDEGIQYLQIGQNMMQYAQHVYTVIKQGGCEVIKDLCGHGVGVKVHEPPYVLNRPHKSMKNTLVKKNMVLALEPITALSSRDYITQGARDIITTGGDLGGQREYTVWISDHGPVILAGIQEDPL